MGALRVWGPGSRARLAKSCSPGSDIFGGNATVRGRPWYILWDAPVLPLDMTASGDRSLRESNEVEGRVWGVGLGVLGFRVQDLSSGFEFEGGG